MKTRHFSLILLLCCSSFLFGCRKGKDGEPGPSGVAGVAGQNAPDNLSKQGKISGTLYYSYNNSYTNTNDTLMIPFEYEYYESESKNAFTTFVDPQTQQGFHQYDLMRRELKESDSYMGITYDYGLIATGPTASDFTINFSLSRIMSSNTYYGFDFYSNFNGGSDNSDMIISNYDFNASTGDLKFDYEIDADPTAVSTGRNLNTTGRPKIIGSVNVTMKRALGGSYTAR